MRAHFQQKQQQQQQRSHEKSLLTSMNIVFATKTRQSRSAEEEAAFERFLHFVQDLRHPDDLRCAFFDALARVGSSLRGRVFRSHALAASVRRFVRSARVVQRFVRRVVLWRRNHVCQYVLNRWLRTHSVPDAAVDLDLAMKVVVRAYLSYRRLQRDALRAAAAAAAAAATAAPSMSRTLRPSSLPRLALPRPAAPTSARGDGKELASGSGSGGFTAATLPALASAFGIGRCYKAAPGSALALQTAEEAAELQGTALEVCHQLYLLESVELVAADCRAAITTLYAAQQLQHRAPRLDRTVRLAASVLSSEATAAAGGGGGGSSSACGQLDEELEREYVDEAIDKVGGRRRDAAAALLVPRTLVFLDVAHSVSALLAAASASSAAAAPGSALMSARLSARRRGAAARGLPPSHHAHVDAPLPPRHRATEVLTAAAWRTAPGFYAALREMRGEALERAISRLRVTLSETSSLQGLDLRKEGDRRVVELLLTAQLGNFCGAWSRVFGAPAGGNNSSTTSAAAAATPAMAAGDDSARMCSTLSARPHHHHHHHRGAHGEPAVAAPTPRVPDRAAATSAIAGAGTPALLLASGMSMRQAVPLVEHIFDRHLPRTEGETLVDIRRKIFFLQLDATDAAAAEAAAAVVCAAPEPQEVSEGADDLFAEVTLLGSEPARGDAATGCASEEELRLRAKRDREERLRLQREAQARDDAAWARREGYAEAADPARCERASREQRAGSALYRKGCQAIRARADVSGGCGGDAQRATTAGALLLGNRPVAQRLPRGPARAPAPAYPICVALSAHWTRRRSSAIGGQQQQQQHLLPSQGPVVTIGQIESRVRDVYNGRAPPVRLVELAVGDAHMASRTVDAMQRESDAASRRALEAVHTAKCAARSEIDRVLDRATAVAVASRTPPSPPQPQPIPAARLRVPSALKRRADEGEAPTARSDSRTCAEAAAPPRPPRPRRGARGQFLMSLRLSAS